MSSILWLSGDDITNTRICEFKKTIPIVEEAFRLFEEKEAIIVEESALYLSKTKGEESWYSLPAYVGGSFDVCGIKWSAHGKPLEGSDGKSRINALIAINDSTGSNPLAIMNGTQIGAMRTGTVTTLAFKYLAPLSVKKIALCGAGGQGEYQLRAILYSFPEAEEVAIWNRGLEKAETLVSKYQSETKIKLVATNDLDSALNSAEIVVGVTSATEPYLTKERIKDLALYCHVGFNEISLEAIKEFKSIIVDTWDEAKNVSGQSLFRLFRAGLVAEDRISGSLGEIIVGKLALPRSSVSNKIMFDAFGLPIFDIAIAKIAYLTALEKGIGTMLDW